MSSVPILPDRRRPLIFAHRGCSSLAPENTLAAFKKARELGVPGIEMDIHVCASGELIVAHDDTFKRTAEDSRAIEALTLKEIRAIDVGMFFGTAHRGEHPPLLEEVLEEFCPDMYVDIELKTRKTKNDPLPALTAEKIKSFGDRAKSAVTISSFNPLCLISFKQLCPQIPTAVIWSADKEVPLLLRHGFGRIIGSCDYVKPVYLQVNRFSRFKFTVLERRPVVPWTIDDPVLAKRMLDLGCEGIITNRPQDMAFLRGNA
ncbi:MAG: glycerophosphodiester phosphodiesterase [Treponema sp.]|nr:glycerophosphodiester phosphodiesterase [Treponema sp.]